MGLLDYFRGSAKRVTSVQQWIDPTVRLQDVANRYSVRLDQASLIMSATGRIDLCARTFAQTAAATPIRLMSDARTARAHKRAYRPVTMLARKRYAAGNTKSASLADTAKDMVEITDHPALALLADPNQWDTGLSFRRLHFYLSAVLGNCYWCMIESPITGGGIPPVKAALHMYPQHMAVQVSKNGLIDGYRYMRARDSWHVFRPEEVIHFKHFPSPADPYYGIGCLHGAKKYADILQYAVDYEINTLANGLFTNQIVILPPGAGPDAAKGVREWFKRRARGPKDANTPFIAEGDIKVLPSGFNLREMQYDEGQKRYNRAIDDAFGMCGLLDEKADGLTIGNDGQAASMVRFQRQTIAPAVEQFCEYLTERLLLFYGVEVGDMWFAAETSAHEDRSGVAAVQKVQTDSAHRTLNEIRQENGDPPIEGGDVLRYNGVPLDKMGVQNDPFGFGGGGLNFVDSRKPDGGGGRVALPDGDGGGVAPGNGEGGGVRDLRQAAGGEEPATGGGGTVTDNRAGKSIDVTADVAKLKAAMKEAIHEVRNEDAGGGHTHHGCDGEACSHVHQSNGEALCDHRPDHAPRPVRKDANPDAFEAAIRRWFTAVKPVIMGGVTPTGIEVDQDALSTSLAQVFGENLTQPYQQGVQTGAMELHSQVWQVKPQEAIRFAEQYVPRIADSVVSTIVESLQASHTMAIRDAVVAGLTTGTTGGPFSPVAAAIAEKLDGMSNYAAARIADTETARAYNAGKTQAWQDSGLVDGEEMVLSSEPCWVCLWVYKHHRYTPLGDPFVPLGTVATGPGGESYTFSNSGDVPFHPFCRCGKTSVLKQGITEIG